MTRLLCLLSIYSCLTLVAGCEPAKDSKPEFKTTLLLQEPIRPTLLETSTEALWTWRGYSSSKPTLVLIANNPLLQQIPTSMKGATQKLIRSEAKQDFMDLGLASRPNPVIFPQMALSAALENNLFDRVVWILAATKDQQVSRERFLEKMLALGDITEEEAKTFSIQNGVLTGRLRETTFTVAHYQDMPPIEEPVIIHFEMDFFPPLYTNEMKTPLYPLVYEVLTNLRNKNYKALDATISHGNLGSDLPLQIRFLGNLIDTIMADPGKLGSPPSTNEKRHSQALYLENFLQKEMIRDLYLSMEESAPEDASVKYALFQTARRFREGNKALDYLEQAVALEPVYALEYLALAESALEQNLPGQAIDMLELAAKIFPDNPFIDLRQAEILLKNGHQVEAGSILDRLEKLPWSQVYHPEIPVIIKRMKDSLETRSS